MKALTAILKDRGHDKLDYTDNCIRARYKGKNYIYLLLEEPVVERGRRKLEKGKNIGCDASGVYKWEADYVVFKLGTEYILYKIEHLRNLLDIAGFKIKWVADAKYEVIPEAVIREYGKEL